jgi:3-methyladenine DNA glycosylase AlkD
MPTVQAASPLRQASLALKGLVALGRQEVADAAGHFFKTGPDQNSENERFLGISAPILHRYARDMGDAGIEAALPLLHSGWHEARALALLLMIRAFQRGDPALRESIYRLYLRNTDFISNLGLVDMSAGHIVGAWLADKPRERERVLTKLARSKKLFERRIAILATFHYIKQGEYAETLRIAELLLDDREDLIHKAVGWMLREVGKRIGQKEEETFLKRHYRNMPRTMLRYAIERFSETRRKRYLRGTI